MKEYFSIKLLPLAALLVMSCLQFVNVTAQSNYVQHGDSGNYTTNGLPEEATLDGKVSFSYKTKTNSMNRKTENPKTDIKQ